MRRFLQQGYRWRILDDSNAIHRGHIFCGPNFIRGANCPNCKKPLLLFALFDTTDAVFKDKSFLPRSLPLLFCWTCIYAQDTSYYRIRGSTEIELLYCLQGKKEASFPYKDYPVFFPRGIIMLEQIDSREQEEISQINIGILADGDAQFIPETPAHRLGGELYYIQAPRDKICLLCGSEMSMLATVGNTALGGARFTRDDFTLVHFLVCENDWVIASHQECT